MSDQLVGNRLCPDDVAIAANGRTPRVYPEDHTLNVIRRRIICIFFFSNSYISFQLYVLMMYDEM